MAVAELATKISFVGSLKPLDKLNNGLDMAVKGITVATAAFTTAGYAVHAFMQNSLAAADAQGQLARETGMSVEAIQEWGYVASVNGSSAEAFQRSVEGLSKKIGEAATKGSEDFNRLGISVRGANGHVKNTETVLKEVSGRLKGLSKAQQADFLEKLGIDRTMIQTLNLSGDAIDRLRNKARALGVVSQEETDKIIAYNDSMTTLKYGVDALQKKLAIAMIPQVQELSDNFINLLASNKDLIKDGFEKFFKILGIGFKAVYRFGKIIVDLFSGMTKGQKVVVGLTGAIYLLNKAFKMSFIGKAITLISALFLVIDDLKTGMNGGKSVIGDWFKEWTGIDIFPAIEKGIKGLGEAFTFLGDTISATWKFVEPILAMLIKGLGRVIDFWGKVSNFAFGDGSFSDIGDAVVNHFTETGKDIANLFGFGDDDENPNIAKNPNMSKNGTLVGALENNKEEVNNLKLINNQEKNNNLKENNNKDINNQEKIHNIREVNNKEIFNNTKINQNAMLPKVTNSTSNNSNVTNTTNITIDVKSTDPKMAADEIERQMKNANIQFNNGGR